MIGLWWDAWLDSWRRPTPPKRDYATASDWRCTRCGALKSAMLTLDVDERGPCVAGPNEACPLEPVFRTSA